MIRFLPRSVTHNFKALIGFFCCKAAAIPASSANFTLEPGMSSPFPSWWRRPMPGRGAWVFNARGVWNLWVADAPDFTARQACEKGTCSLRNWCFQMRIHDFLLWKDWIRAYGQPADFFDRVLKGFGGSGH
jgi:hypothetical protein